LESARRSNFCFHIEFIQEPVPAFGPMLWKTSRESGTCLSRKAKRRMVGFVSLLSAKGVKNIANREGVSIAGEQRHIRSQ
jgi:hypothetical protein